MPILIDNPAGFGILSGEFEVSWYSSYADFVGVETAGTLMESAGWGTPQFFASPGNIFLAGAGPNPLPGPGVLIYLRFEVHSYTTLTISPGIFNEEYQAYPDNGTITVTALPNLSLSPGTVNLLIGDTQLFTVLGSPTPPLTWSVDDPVVASIDAAGELTALTEGVVQVRVEDALGALALSGAVSVCTLGLPSLSSSIEALEMVIIPVIADRSLTGLGLYSFELEVNFNSTNVRFINAVSAGSATESWGMPVVNDHGGSVSIYQAGSTPLESCGPALVFLIFEGQPDLSYSYTGVTLSAALFNEGKPCVRINTGSPCSSGSNSPLPESRLFLLENHPNPFNPMTTVSFRIQEDGLADLAVYTARGRLVRHLVGGFVSGGQEHEVVWNGRDDAGRLQASGVYYCRLEAGGRSQLRKMVLLK